MKAKEYIEPARAQFSERIRGAQERLSNTARNVRHATDGYVHDNPWKIIAVVAVAACVTGWFLNAARD